MKFLIPCGFCLIFTRLASIRENFAGASRRRQTVKSPVWHAFRAKMLHPSAPIPVIRLWTGCTRLKIRELQMQSFH
jgi:hypothetical protein